MLFLRRRLFTVMLTGVILASAVAWGLQPPEMPVRMFRILLGVGDKTPGKWNGTVAVAGGEVVAIEGWRFEGDDKVDGVKGWNCETRDYIAFEKRTPVQL